MDDQYCKGGNTSTAVVQGTSVKVRAQSPLQQLGTNITHTHTHTHTHTDKQAVRSTGIARTGVDLGGQLLDGWVEARTQGVVMH